LDGLLDGRITVPAFQTFNGGDGTTNECSTGECEAVGWRVQKGKRNKPKAGSVGGEGEFGMKQKGILRRVLQCAARDPKRSSRPRPMALAFRSSGSSHCSKPEQILTL